MSKCDELLIALYKQRQEAMKRGLRDPDMSIVFSNKGYYERTHELESMMVFEDRFEHRMFSGYRYTVSAAQQEPFIILGGPLSV